jgi:integrase
MSIRERKGRWHYRFQVLNQFFNGSTGLTATKQNLNAAKGIEAQRRIEAEHRSGNGQLKPSGVLFQVAASEFLTWCHGTAYRRHPGTARRISGSFASLSKFFNGKNLNEIRPIEIERFKTWRAENFIKDVTIRNDLNALSLLFRYARKARWVESNPLLGDDKVKRPSGEDSIRINVVSPEDERKYFSAIARRRGSGNLYDVARIILLQGCRPDEVMSLKKSSFDAERSQLRIEGGKTRSAPDALPM